MKNLDYTSLNIHCNLYIYVYTNSLYILKNIDTFLMNLKNSDKVTNN